VFEFLKRKKKPEAKADPLAAFDGVIESVDRQGAEVRKSAATLLALRGELTRDVKKYEGRITELNRRVVDASAQAGNERALKTLRRDLEEAQRLLQTTLEAQATSEANAKLLMETAEGLARQVSELREERVSARARLSAGLVVSEALQAKAAEFDKFMKLDAARDEIERANALAELYRDDQR
jgi:hypothetical protein